MKNNVEQLLHALRNGKIIRRKDGVDNIGTRIPTMKVYYADGSSETLKKNDKYFYTGINIPIDKPIKEVKVVGESTYDTYKVDYYFFNPQCNRCLAMLTNGEITDYSPSLVDLMWNEYEILDKKESIPKVTMSEVYAKFGRVVEIVDK